MKIKTDRLIGTALDWAVAKAEGHDVAVADGTGLVIIRRQNVVDYFDPSTNWGWGGPIIEREQIEVSPGNTEEAPERQPYGFLASSWCARSLSEFMYDSEHHHGPTPLIASMRCYVASRLGDEVDVPEVLCEQISKL